ncbi:rabenosyn-5 isoform X2 [Athalia rosae]|uniref:rabenosyn-5 isoform X2 n=1 Tax=Athalia rosae TaxID=37344 RepID=UPI0020348FAD|nr:rabenosyn-5 isoform X2 [Athalia rosae]
MAESGQVLEGFLCSICLTDLKTPHQLTKHFEEFHNDNPEILKTLKELYGKAKKKMLKHDDISEGFTPPVIQKNQESSLDLYYRVWEPQELGETRSYTRYFTEIRNVRLERYSTETNKLLIRLDKLLNELPSDPISRRAHEQAIVPWIDDKSVKLCPNCAKSFHVARRKHHCRLCGAVMCHDCTMFLSLADARKMINPTLVQDDSAISPTSSGSPIAGRFIRAGIGLSKLARSPSSGSLNSVLSLVNDSSNGEQHFRLCVHCEELLSSRERLKETKLSKPIICQFYEKMRSYIDEANEHSMMYNKMCNSLRKGETTYNLEDAQVLKGRIEKLAANIDLISKKILILGIKDVDNPPQGQVLRLQQMVRSSATIFLKEHLPDAEQLPTEEEYIALKEKRRQAIEARIEYERQMELEELQKEKRRELQKREGASTDSIPGSRSEQLVLDQSQGWGTSSAAPMLTASMDPIIEQMNNLRAYIKQARDAHKYDEVATLETNLRELQSAYFAMKQSSNSDS